jgi:DNA-binding IclR family transcriptional regulator
MDKEGLPSFTEHTITDRDIFLAEMQTIRKQGFGLDLEEHELGVHCIAVPIKDSRGQVIAAISISGPVNIMPGDLANSHIRDELLETADIISRDFIAKVKPEGERDG